MILYFNSTFNQRQRYFGLIKTHFHEELLREGTHLFTKPLFQNLENIRRQGLFNTSLKHNSI